MVLARIGLTETLVVLLVIAVALRPIVRRALSR
jgi:hypothetical protein